MAAHIVYSAHLKLLCLTCFKVSTQLMGSPHIFGLTHLWNSLLQDSFISVRPSTGDKSSQKYNIYVAGNT